MCARDSHVHVAEEVRAPLTPGGAGLLKLICYFIVIYKGLNAKESSLLDQQNNVNKYRTHSIHMHMNNSSRRVEMHH